MGALRRVLVGVVFSVFAGNLAGQTPAFEAASIKLNPGCNGNELPTITPRRLVLKCISIRGQIRRWSAERTRRVEILGGPAWLDKDRYDITAVTAENTSAEQMMGPMMRQLLEERFQLQAHKDQKVTPVFRMTVAASGLKIKASKTECVSLKLGELPTLSDGEKYCGYGASNIQGSLMIQDRHGLTIPEFISTINFYAGRPIVDGTGLTGRFDFHMEFVRERNGGGPVLLNGEATLMPNDAADPTGPSIFTALRDQAGLVLTPDKIPLEVIVVDRAEKPSGN